MITRTPISAANSDNVVVVDDDPIFRSVAEPCLMRAGFSIVACRDGIEALNYLEGNTADIALVDLSMPRLDGFRLMSMVRNLPLHRCLPIMVVSARNDVEAIEEAYRTGADAFITKPVNWTILPHQVRYAIGTARRLAHLRAEVEALRAEKSGEGPR